VTPDVVAALMLSLRVATVSILVIGPPAVALAYVMARSAFPGRDFIGALLSLPLVLPPTAIGLVLLRLFGARGPLGRDTLGFDLGFLLTWRGAVAACSVMALPLVVRTARIAFEGVDPRLEAMARTLGHGALATFVRFTLPLAARGLTAAAILGFTRAVGEFGATVMIAGNIPGRTRTLASGIYAAQQAGRDDEATALVIVAILVGFVAIFASERLTRPRGRRTDAEA
jgi:molybdate transport system permease protein